MIRVNILRACVDIQAHGEQDGWCDRLIYGDESTFLLVEKSTDPKCLFREMKILK